MIILLLPWQLTLCKRTELYFWDRVSCILIFYLYLRIKHKQKLFEYRADITKLISWVLHANNTIIQLHNIHSLRWKRQEFHLQSYAISIPRRVTLLFGWNAKCITIHVIPRKHFFCNIFWYFWKKTFRITRKYKRHVSLSVVMNHRL